MPLPLSDADYQASFDEEAARVNQMARDAKELGVQIDTQEGEPEELDEDGALAGTEPVMDPDMEDDGTE